MKTLVLLFCLVLMIAAAGVAQVTGYTTLIVTTGYYVSTTGSDANDGSAAHPWATIQHAADSAHAGMLIHVAPGTYNTSAVITSSVSHVRYISDQQWGAKIVTTDTQAWANTGAYVDIMGFDISGNGNTIIGIHSEGNYDRSIGNRVHDMGSTGCQSGAGILIGGGATNQSAIANYVYKIGPLPPAVPGCNQIQGIYALTSGSVIVNNIAFNNAGKGIQVYGEAPGDIANGVVANNTVFNNQDGIVIGADGTLGGFTDRAIVTNNICYENVRYGLYESGSVGTHNQYLNNLIYANPGGTYMITGTLPGTVAAAPPQFVNYTGDASGDYRLSSTSPAIDHGTAVGAPSTDFSGGPRPQGSAWDIGAYQYLAIPALWPWM